MACRAGCGACCIAISISSPLPGMPGGKPAGVRCLHLDKHNMCELFGKPQRPAVCGEFQAEDWLCGATRAEALERITLLERQTTAVGQQTR